MAHIQLQLFANNGVNALIVQHFWHFINAVGIVAAHHRAFFHIAKQRDFAAFFVGQDSVHAADEDVGLQADAEHFFNGVLRGLGFDFACRRDIRHIRQMHKQGVGAAKLAAHLADGFQKRQRFNIAHRATDFHNRHVFARCAFVDAAFDFIGDVGDDLHRAAQIIAAPLFGNHVFIHLPRAETVGAGERGVDKAFVMPEV